MTGSGATGRRQFSAMLGAVLGGWLLGCGAGKPPPRVAREPDLEPLNLRPISQLAVGAGLQWLVLARPKEVFGHKALAPALARLVSPVRRKVFQKVTAIDLASLDGAVVAGYESSTLFLLDGVADPLEAEKRFRDRLLHDVVRKTFRPDAIWTHGRMASGGTRAFSALVPGVVAIEGGGSLHAKVALLFAIGRLHKSPRALSLPYLEQVAGALGDAPVVALALGPFEGEWDEALHGMLGVCTAVGGSARLGAHGEVGLSFRLAGAWGGDSDRAGRTLEAAWRDLVQSSLGRLLSLDEPIVNPRVTADPELVGLDVQVDGVNLLTGLYDLVAADVRELMDLGMDATR